jgi:hypothetical protein
LHGCLGQRVGQILPVGGSACGIAFGHLGQRIEQDFPLGLAGGR